MGTSESVISQIKSRLDLATVIGEYVTLHKKGGRYWGLCPFHQEKTPSFTVSPDRGIFHCFGCQKGGDLLTFIMEIEKVPFPEALRICAHKAGVELPTAGEPSDAPKRDAYMELYRRVAGSFHHLLMKTAQGEAPRRYLLGRGLEERVLEEFQLGYAPADRGWLWDFLLAKNYTGEFLRKSGLFVESSRGGSRSLFGHRIVFPIANARGETIAFGGRALEEGVPKYLNTPETDYFRKGENLFGLDKAVKPIRTEGFFIVVEGYMDLLALHQAGIHHVVAPLGTALTEQQVKLLKRYASRAVLLFDSDAAGRKAAVRSLELCERSEVEASVAAVQGDKDPADLMAKGESDAIRTAVQGAAAGFSWLLEGALASHGNRTPEGRTRVCDDLFPLCGATESRVKQESWLDMLADALGVDRDAVRRDFQASQARGPAPRDARQPAQQPLKRTIGPELFLMIAAALNRGAFEEVRKRGVGADDLDEAPARELFIALEESFRAGDSSLEDVASRLADEGLRMLLREKASTDEFTMNPMQMIADGTRRIRLRSFERRRDQKIADLRRFQEKNDLSALSEIQGEITYLVGEIENLKVGYHAGNQD